MATQMSYSYAEKLVQWSGHKKYINKTKKTETYTYTFKGVQIYFALILNSRRRETKSCLLTSSVISIHKEKEM